MTAKDLRLGPRSPFFLWALALPVLMTFLVSAVFGDLFEPPPRLAVVDQGSSTVTSQLLRLDGVEVDVLDDEQSLRDAVEAHDYDAGLLLPPDLDDALATGTTVPLRFYVSGQSLASTRVVLAVTTLEQLRAAAGQGPGTEVVVTRVGDRDYVPIETRLLPFIVLYAVLIAGLFLPATSLVEEREQRTLDALLVTPLRVSEVLVGKATLGVLLAVVMGWVTLAINDAFAGRQLAMTVFLLAGAVMMAEVGTDPRLLGPGQQHVVHRGQGWRDPRLRTGHLHAVPRPAAVDRPGLPDVLLPAADLRDRHHRDRTRRLPGLELVRLRAGLPGAAARRGRLRPSLRGRERCGDLIVPG